MIQLSYLPYEFFKFWPAQTRRNCHNITFSLPADFVFVTSADHLQSVHGLHCMLFSEYFFNYIVVPNQKQIKLQQIHSLQINFAISETFHKN